MHRSLIGLGHVAPWDDRINDKLDERLAIVFVNFERPRFAAHGYQVIFAQVRKNDEINPSPRVSQVAPKPSANNWHMAAVGVSPQLLPWVNTQPAAGRDLKHPSFPFQVVDRGGPSRMLFKGLILLSAAGVKIREGKRAAAVRHAGRAAALLRRLMIVPELAFERALGMSPAALAEYAETAAKTHAALQATAPGQPQPVFNFILGSNSHGRPSGQVS